jgi:hypothetical protein
LISIRKTIAQKLAETKFGKNAVQEKADLSVFKQRPSFRVTLGIILMGISYVLGWPAISLMGVIAYTYDLPLLFFAGSPVVYVISHLIFLLGLYLAGANYAKIFLRWAVRRMIEKYAFEELESK